MKFIKNKKIMSLLVCGLLAVPLIMGFSKNSVGALKKFGQTVNGLTEVTDKNTSLIYSISVGNASSTHAYLQVFDADSDDVTLGTTTPDYEIFVATGQTVVWPQSGGTPILHSTGLSVAGTSNSEGASLTDLIVAIGYADKEI